MKEVLNISLAIAVALLLGSCAVTDIDRTANFNAYKTFGFSTAEVSVNHPAYKSSLISSKIRRDIKTEFEKRGLVYSEKDPDLLVSYGTYTADKEQYSGGYGYPYMFMYPGMMMYRGFPMMYPYMGYGAYGGGRYTYTEGTLIIDVADAHSKEQVWRGLVKGNVSNLNTLSKSIDKGVKAIMKKYPGSADPDEKTIEQHQKKVG